MQYCRHGRGGFIGRHVAKRLSEIGCKVVGVDDFSSGRPDALEFLDSLICVDLSDAHALDALPSSCDYIFHLAGQSSGEISFDDPIEDLKKNTLSTLNLIKYGVAATAQRIVYASSMSVYGAWKTMQFSRMRIVNLSHAMELENFVPNIIFGYIRTNYLSLFFECLMFMARVKT